MIKKKGIYRGVSVLLSLTLSLGLTFGAVPMEVWAAEDAESGSADEKQYEIASFEELPEEIRQQNVVVGTTVEELNLPDTLTVSCYFETEQHEDSDNQKPDKGEPKPGEDPDSEEEENDQEDEETELGEDQEAGEEETEPGEDQTPEGEESEPGEDQKPEDEETEPGENQKPGEENEPGENGETEGESSESGDEDQAPGTGDSGTEDGESGSVEQNQEPEAGTSEPKDENRESGSSAAKPEENSGAEGGKNEAGTAATASYDEAAAAITTAVHMREYLAEPDYIEIKTLTYSTEKSTSEAENTTEEKDASEKEDEFEEKDATGEEDTPGEETASEEDTPKEENKTEEGNVPEGESGNEDENKHETVRELRTVTIEGITWISAPEYDGTLEGIYVFTPILPGEYSAEEGVSLPEITVTVEEEEPAASGRAKVPNDGTETVAPACGVISTDTTWTAGTLTSGTVTVEEGVTLTLMGQINISGAVMIEGSGTIEKGSTAARFSVSSAADSLTLRQITIDGKSLSSSNSIIYVNLGKLTLDDGCTMMNCKSSGYGGAVYLTQAEAVINEAMIKDCSASMGGAIYMESGSKLELYDGTIENCVAQQKGGAINSFTGSTINIYGGTYRNNKTTSLTDVEGFVGGGFIYTCRTNLTITGGSFTGNTAVNKGGCIYHCGHAVTNTYIFGGHFENNTCSYEKYQGSGGVYVSSVDPGQSFFYLAGNANFAGDGKDIGTDGIYLDQQNNAPRRIYIKDAVNYPVTIYVEASEGYIIAEGYDYTILENSDMKKIKFVNVGDEGEQWYPVLDKATNKVKLSTTPPPYMDNCFVYYISNGAKGTVKDDNNNDDGYAKGTTVEVKPADGLEWENRQFAEWNTKPDGSGKGYQPGDSITLTDDIDLYAIFTDNIVTYRVEHYQQNMDGKDYTVAESDTLSAVEGRTVTAVPNTYEGFTENTEHTSRIPSGKVAGDGSLVLRLYYDRNVYTIYFDSNDGGRATLSTQPVLYGNCVIRPNDPVRDNFNFEGWYKDPEGTEESIWNFDEPVQDNTTELETTLYAKWTEKPKSSRGKTTPGTVPSGGGGVTTETSNDGGSSYNSDTSVITTFVSVTQTAPTPRASDDREPKTGTQEPVWLYATIGMIAGLSYIMLLFTEDHGMTEEAKKEYIARMVEWAKRGGVFRRMIALAGIFMLLVYYHSIGKQQTVEWRVVYETYSFKR